MDLSIEDSKVVRTGAGLAVLVICLAIAFRCAIDRSLAMVNKSLTGTLLVVGYADDILDDLDRKKIDQRAFLSTGNDCFFGWHLRKCDRSAGRPRRARTAAEPRAKH